MCSNQLTFGHRAFVHARVGLVYQSWALRRVQRYPHIRVRIAPLRVFELLMRTTRIQNHNYWSGSELFAFKNSADHFYDSNVEINVDYIAWHFTTQKNHIMFYRSIEKWVRLITIKKGFSKGLADCLSAWARLKQIRNKKHDDQQRGNGNPETFPCYDASSKFLFTLLVVLCLMS